MIYNVKCNKCNKKHEIQIELEYVGSDEDRGMGAELFYSGSSLIDCACGNKIELSIEASEYPEGAGLENYNTDISGGTLV